MNDINISDVMGKMIEDPDMLKKAMAAAQSLMSMQNAKDDGTSDTGNESENAGDEKNENADDEKNKNADGEIGVPRAMTHGGKEDDKTRLLLALRPYMNEKRRDKIDGMIKLMKLMELADIGSVIKKMK